MKTQFAAAATAALALGAAACAQATTTTIYLGASAQNYVLYGQGPLGSGPIYGNTGTFTNQQGSETVNGGMVTDTLSGAITSSTDAGLASGSYTFVTTYSGVPIGSGGTEVQSYSSAPLSNYFYYGAIDPSVDITLYLSGTPTGDHTLALFTNGAYDGIGFSFANLDTTCTGVAVCSQNNVGLVPGATQSGQVDITISYTTPTPEPAAWALMLLGLGGLGGALRERRRLERLVVAS